MPKRVHDGLKKRCDCGKRKWPKCTHGWHFSLHHGRHEHRYSLDVIARARGEHRPTSKTEAEVWRDRLRSEIRAGKFVDPAAPPPVSDARLTFGDVADQYLKRHVQTPTRRPRGRREMEIMVALVRRAEIPAAKGATVRLETKPMDAITRADVEAVRTWRRSEQAAGVSRPGAKGGEVGINRLLSRLRHVFSWAIAEGHITETPFKRGPVSVVKMETSVEGARTRRLEPSMPLPDGKVRDGEETRLLTHAGAHLRALIVAALSTGARLGELLSLQWSQIQRDENGEVRWIILPPTKTKTAQGRSIPVSSRLRAELAMRRHAPDGTQHGPDGYVFGNECGERVTSIRTAWAKTCKRAGINGLHFHDLRREFASRLLESRADLHDVSMFLGHAAITTTSRYVQSTPLRLERALARMEDAAARSAPDSEESPAVPRSEAAGPSVPDQQRSLN
jgi:integrase